MPDSSLGAEFALAGEVRATQHMRGGTQSRWTPIRKRIEVKDCVTYSIWLEARLDLWSPGKAKWWDRLEAQVAYTAMMTDTLMEG